MLFRRLRCQPARTRYFHSKVVSPCTTMTSMMERFRLPSHLTRCALHYIVRKLVQQFRVSLARRSMCGPVHYAPKRLGGHSSQEEETRDTGDSFFVSRSGIVARIPSERNTDPCHKISCKIRCYLFCLECLWIGAGKKGLLQERALFQIF